MKKIFGFLACAAVVCGNSNASAQMGGFGGIKSPVGGSGSGSSASAGDIDSYLARSTETAQLMMTAIAILDYARGSQADMAALKAQITTIQSKKDPKELNAYKTSIAPQTKALNDDANAAANIQAGYQKASAQEKALISAAVYNMVIAVPRAETLASKGPDLIKGLGSNPTALTQVGKIKGAVELFGYQIGATGKFVSVLPKLMSAVKVQAPADPQAAKPQVIAL